MARPHPTTTAPAASIKWNMKASKLEYAQLKIFCEMFEEYIDVQHLGDREAKLLPFQSVEDVVQKFVCVAFQRN